MLHEPLKEESWDAGMGHGLKTHQLRNAMALVVFVDRPLSTHGYTSLVRTNQILITQTVIWIYTHATRAVKISSALYPENIASSDARSICFRLLPRVGNSTKVHPRSFSKLNMYVYV